jgi:dolichol-phosphate mannosyltransferase
LNPIVIIPTYNECENIKRMLETVMSLHEDFDVLVVDDNSPDGTADLVKDAQAIYPRIH